jgi:hypothetical protein
MTPHRIDNLNIYIYSNDDERKLDLTIIHTCSLINYPDGWIACYISVDLFSKKEKGPPINYFPSNKVKVIFICVNGKYLYTFTHTHMSADPAQVSKSFYWVLEIN